MLSITFRIKALRLEYMSVGIELLLNEVIRVEYNGGV